MLSLSSISDLLADTKQLVGKSKLARDVVSQYRLRTGQPDWAQVISDPRYKDILRNGAKSNACRVLIATSGGGHLGGTRVESLLALALTARGAKVDVLLCDAFLPACQESTLHWYVDAEPFAARGPSRLHCSACFGPAFKMYHSIGVQVHKYSEYVSAKEVKQAMQLADKVPWDELRSFQNGGVSVGEHAVAGAIRFFAQALLGCDPVTEKIVRRYFAAAFLSTQVARRILRAGQYDVAVFHHGIYVPQGLLGDVCRQEAVRVVNWHVAYRKKTFLFSHGDTYHRTLLTEPLSAWESIPWTPSLDARACEYLQSRWKGTGDWIHFNRAPQTELDAIAKEVGVDFSKPCIGMLTNVMWDAQLHYPANAFPDMLDWAVKTIDYFAGRPELQLLIRVHPAEIRGALPSLQPFVQEIRKVYRSLPPNVFIIPPESKASTYAAMFQCNAAIIYGTKTGVELTAMGIPVVVAGEAWIRNKGLTLDSTSQQEYIAILDQLPLPSRLDQETVARARKFAFHYFFRRMIPIAFTRVVSGSPGFEFDVPGIDTLGPGGDPGLDVICEGILNQAPFIYPAEND